MPFELPFLNDSETEVEKLQNQIDSDWRYQRALNKASQEKIELLEHDLNKLMNINHALKMENLELKSGDYNEEGWKAFYELAKEHDLLKKKLTRIKETLLPVCEYAAEIYNRGIPAGEMPADTIQRLNWAFKMFGG